MLEIEHKKYIFTQSFRGPEAKHSHSIYTALKTNKGDNKELFAGVNSSIYLIEHKNLTHFSNHLE